MYTYSLPHMCMNEDMPTHVILFYFFPQQLPTSQGFTYLGICLYTYPLNTSFYVEAKMGDKHN